MNKLRIIPKGFLVVWHESEVARFLVVGGATVLIDLMFYIIVVYLGVSTVLAKGIGFICGTIFAYFYNKNITFRSSRSGEAGFSIFVLLYLVTLVVNVFANESVLQNIGYTQFAFVLAFFVATSISATMNFIGMKYMVFSDARK